MVYGIFRKHAKPNSKNSWAIPYQSGFKRKSKAKSYLKKMRAKGVRGYKVVNLR